MKELGRFCGAAGLAMLVLAACAADRATKPDPSYGAPREVTPLHEAARDGHAGIVRALLADGAEVDARAEGEVTPLHLAATLGHTATSRALIEGGANVNARAEGKTTPLHYAATFGHTATVRALIEGGANVNARAEGKATPLHSATAAGMYLALRDADTKVDTDVHEWMARFEDLAKMPGFNPLDKTFVRTRMADTAALIDTGLISAGNQTETIRALLAGGADVYARAEGKFAPLHYAAMFGDSVAVRALIEGGANVNARAEGKLTPLHYAALLGNAGAIEALLEAGGNPNAVAFGCGPMDVARLRMKATERSIAPFREAVEHLRAAGAQPRKGCKLR